MEKLFKNKKEYNKWIESLTDKGEVNQIVSPGSIQVIFKDYNGWEDVYQVRIKELEVERMERTWGGFRPGAGRKKSGRNAALSCTIKPENKKFLEQRAKETGLTVTEVLEMIIETFIDEHK